MEFLKSKNIMLYATIAIVGIFSVFYFLLANKASYAFVTDNNSLYDSKIQMIEESAKVYAEYNDDIFEEKAYVYFTVNELVENGVILPDNEAGEVKDPRGNVKTLNDLKVRIDKKKDGITAKVLN